MAVDVSQNIRFIACADGFIWYLSDMGLEGVDAQRDLYLCFTMYQVLCM